MHTDTSNADDDPARRQAARYVAIIADGNGRWARSRGCPSTTATRRGPTP